LNKRFYSLDVFRGATVALMILVNNPGSWTYIYGPLKHAPWHGATPTDLVFPFFLFAVGNALAFVMPKLEAGGNKVFWQKILKRTLLIFLIGLFLNWSPFVKWSGDILVFKYWVDPENPENGIRILGVLQRIALCYFVASILIYYFKPRGAFFTGLLLLLVYWLMCIAFGSGDPFSLINWFGTTIDRAILGVPHMYKGEGIPFDPEGLASTIPAIVQVIFGYLVGDYILKKGTEPPVLQGANQAARDASFGMYPMIAGLFVAGVAFTVTGMGWGLVFPINKKIWTSSYTVYTTGLAIITLATMIYYIEIKKRKGWLTRFFDVFGKNALFVFALSGLLPRLSVLVRIPNGVNAQGEPKYTSAFGWFYENICKPIPGPAENGSLFYAICMILFYWAICYVLDRKKIYIKV
jgi:predicted acyltransferase